MHRFHRFAGGLTLLLIAAVSAPACGPDEVEDPTDSGPADSTADAADAGDTGDTGIDVDTGPTFDEDACRNFVIPHRFGFSWEKLNHRVSSWDTRLDAPDADPCRAETLSATVIGGDFSTGMAVEDTPTLKYGFQTHESEAAGPIGAARESVSVTLDPTGVVEDSATFSRGDLDLEHFQRVIPVIEGFGFDTDVEKPDGYPEDYNPAHGYVVRGFGASVETAELTDDEVTIDYRIRLAPGTSADREKHNTAVPHARLDARLDVLLVGVSEHPVQTGAVDYKVAYPKPKPAEDDDFPPASEKKQRLRLQGKAGEGRGFWGLQSFNFDLYPVIVCDLDRDCPKGETCNKDEQTCSTEQGEPGFYVRELTVDARQKAYDADSGEATFLVNGYASNATQFIGFWGLNSEFDADLAWVQTPNATEDVRYETAFETGTKDFTLSEMAK